MKTFLFDCPSVYVSYGTKHPLILSLFPFFRPKRFKKGTKINEEGDKPNLFLLFAILTPYKNKSKNSLH